MNKTKSAELFDLCVEFAVPVSVMVGSENGDVSTIIYEPGESFFRAHHSSLVGGEITLLLPSFNSFVISNKIVDLYLSIALKMAIQNHVGETVSIVNHLLDSVDKIHLDNVDADAEIIQFPWKETLQ